MGSDGTGKAVSDEQEGLVSLLTRQSGADLEAWVSAPRKPDDDDDEDDDDEDDDDEPKRRRPTRRPIIPGAQVSARQARAWIKTGDIDGQ